MRFLKGMDTDRLKMLFGLILLLALVALIAIIAIGHVEEKSSYGLLPIIATLSTLAGAFGNWAFGTKSGNGNEKHKDGGPNDSANGKS